MLPPTSFQTNSTWVQTLLMTAISLPASPPCCLQTTMRRRVQLPSDFKPNLKYFHKWEVACIGGRRRWERNKVFRLRLFTQLPMTIRSRPTTSKLATRSSARAVHFKEANLAKFPNSSPRLQLLQAQISKSSVTVTLATNSREVG